MPSRRLQQRARRRHKVPLQASQEYQVLFQSDQPYLVQPEQALMSQRMAVVEVRQPQPKLFIAMWHYGHKGMQFADDHDEKEIAGATALMLDKTGTDCKCQAAALLHVLHSPWNITADVRSCKVGNTPVELGNACREHTQPVPQRHCHHWLILVSIIASAQCKLRVRLHSSMHFVSLYLGLHCKPECSVTHILSSVTLG